MEDFIKASNAMYQIYNGILADLDPTIFMAIIATLIDTYEDDHPDDFDGAQFLKDTLKIRDEVNEEVNNKTDEEILSDPVSIAVINQLFSRITE